MKSFTEVVDSLGFHVGYMIGAKDSLTFQKDYKPDHKLLGECFEKCVEAYNDLVVMGQSNAINTVFWSVANASYYYSGHQEFSDHQMMCEEVFMAIVDKADFLREEQPEVEAEIEKVEDEVYEYTSDKEFLTACLALDSSVNNQFTLFTINMTYYIAMMTDEGNWKALDLLPSYSDAEDVFDAYCDMYPNAYVDILAADSYEASIRRQ